MPWLLLAFSGLTFASALGGLLLDRLGVPGFRGCAAWLALATGIESAFLIDRRGVAELIGLPLILLIFVAVLALWAAMLRRLAWLKRRPRSQSLPSLWDDWDWNPLALLALPWSLFGICRLARPGSWWAERFYDEAKKRRAEERLEHYDSFWAPH